MKPGDLYVVHGGKRWLVVREEAYDGEPGFLLQRGGLRGYDTGRVIWARRSECRLCTRTRRFAFGDKVLECRPDGSLRVRRARSSKRWPITLDQIYDYAIRLATFKNGRLPKTLRARQRRR